MIAFFFMVLTSLSVFAAEPAHWSHLLDISEQHEFYPSNEPIVKPTNSWQTLFGFNYIDQRFQRLKDCVFYKVPGVDAGELKIKTISSLEKCDSYLLKEGDAVVKNIKTFLFILVENKITFDMTFLDFKSEKWEAFFQKKHTRPGPAMHLSSAEFKSPKIIFLAAGKNLNQIKAGQFLAENSLCHDINEECQEMKPSTCDQCARGWYEIPNGCSSGPKYCGALSCGKKNGPACRRGMVWQKTEEAFDCVTNSTFAYCAEGLTVFCEGKKAYCR